MRLSDNELSDLFGRLDDGELLGLWASLMAELNRRGVIRAVEHADRARSSHAS